MSSPKSIPSPQAQFFDGMPEELQALASSLLGAIPTPIDQPRLSQVIYSMSAALVEFAKTHDFYLNHNAQQVEVAARLAQFAAVRAEFDITPITHLIGRMNQYGAWALGMELDPQQREISVPLGAEVALALANGRQLNTNFTTALRRDLRKVPLPAHRSASTDADLQALGFGKLWRNRFDSTLLKLSRLCLLKDTASKQLSHGLSEVGAEHLLNIKAAAANVTSKQRSGVRNHRQLTDHQLQEYVNDLRQRLVSPQRAPGVIAEALSFFTGLAHRQVLNIALGQAPLAGELLTLNLARGGLHVELAHMISRVSDLSTPAGLYGSAETDYFIPWPAELINALHALKEQTASTNETWRPTLRIVDLLPQADRDHLPLAGVSAICTIDERAHGFTPTQARARNTQPSAAIAAGLSRTYTAFACLAFGLIGRARLWYLRIDTTDFELNWTKFLIKQGWSVTVNTPARRHFGSTFVLRDSSVQELWTHLESNLTEIPSGPRMTLPGALKFHNSYARFVSIALAFSLALRTATRYELNASSFNSQRRLLPFNDKADPHKSASRFLIMTPFVRQTIDNWYAHCASLLARAERDPQTCLTEAGMAIIEHLRAVVSQKAVALLFLVQPSGIRPIGSKAAFARLPHHLQCVPNFGRHYWATHLFSSGCTDDEIDLFLRHMTVGSSPTDAYSVVSLNSMADLISSLQEEQIEKLALRVPVGLRKAR